MANPGDGGFDKHISKPVAGSDSAGLRAESSISLTDNTNIPPLQRALSMQSYIESMPTKDQLSAMTAEQIADHLDNHGKQLEGHYGYMASLSARGDDLSKTINAHKHLTSPNGKDFEITST